MKSSSHTRRSFLKALGISTTAMFATPHVLNNLLAVAGDSRRPNVVVVQPDQHRGTVMHCAGDEQIHTPNLDRLAVEGIRFTNCVSASPVCSPFRGTMQTGLYCYQHGVVSNNIQMDMSLTTFAETFAEAGYATGYIGKWHLDGGWPTPFPNGKGEGKVRNLGYVPEENRQGWQEWLGHEKGHQYFTVARLNDRKESVRVAGYDWEPTWHTDMALDFARRHQSSGKPWLYYLAYGPPHLPRESPHKYLDMYPPEKFVFPPDVERDLPEERHKALRKELQMYYAQVTAVDVEIGRLLDGLKRIGADENTVILYTSDHGDFLGSHFDRIGKLRGKANPYAAALRIPLIIRWPAAIAPNQVCDAPVSSIDLTPTILDLGGFDVPDYMPGHSMAGWCLEGKGHMNDVLYLGLGDGKPLPEIAISPSAKKNMEPGQVKRSGIWRAAWDGRYVYFPGSVRSKKGGWLYDHQTDPHEMKNLVNSPGHLDVKKRLARAMLEIAQETSDPALPELRQLLEGKGVL